MNSLEITRYLRHNKFTKQYFVGCYPIDKLPTRANANKLQLFVVNVSESTQKGLHWFLIAVYPTGRLPKQQLTHHPDQILIYDSCVTNIFKSNFFIEEFFDRNKRSYIIFNRCKTQGDFSDICGEHVLTIGYLLSKGINFEQILSLFHKTNFQYNDKLILYLFARYFVGPSFELDHFKGVSRY